MTKVKILHTLEDSIADQLEIEPGDSIVAIDNLPVRDFLDVLLAEKKADLSVLVEKGDGDLWQLDIEKEADEPLGISLEHPAPKHCGNSCIFCFVHQLPKGMRDTLYVKDEDYRFSYLYGAYITLSNLTESDVDRIIAQKLSPLYISVHATDEQVRAQMLGRDVPPIMPLLERLAQAGIDLHTQIVVCPGINDGDVLEGSIAALGDLAPGIRSLALVPVGLTAHRQKLYPLRLHTAAEAGTVLDVVNRWQGECLERFNRRFVFAADEFYLRAGRGFPTVDAYETLDQLENGVGMIPLFKAEGEGVLREAESVVSTLRYSVVTGRAFASELESFLSELDTRTGACHALFALNNDFFGTDVTVTGLVAGVDLIKQLSGKDLGSILLIPDVMLREEGDVFLDNTSLEDVAESLDCQVVVIPSDPMAILEVIDEFKDFYKNER